MMPITTTFIGHQSWLVEIDGTRLLVDPVLTDSFGNTRELRFEIYPARTVDVDAMPDIDAVVVTNEHLDHFHLPSLSLVPNHVPILLPALTPTVCVAALRDLGKSVRLLGHGQAETVGAADVVLLQGSPDAPIWESRVACAYLTPRGTQGGVLVQSDTAFDDHPSLLALEPDVLIATHNGQVPPAGASGAFDNMLPLPPEAAEQTTGLQLLNAVLNDAVERFPSARWVLLSGGGYVQVPAKHGEFLWSDFTELAELANRLTMKARMVGLRPGEQAELSGPEARTSRASWILPASPVVPVAPADRNARREVDPGAELSPVFDRTVGDRERALLLQGLDELAPLLLNAPLGRSLLATNDYLGEPTGSLRFAVQLLRFEPGRDVGYALNINTAKFEATALDVRSAVYSVPSGIVVHASDLAAVFAGEVHIWEVATSRMRQWYLTSRLDSPVGFLYGALSEQVRPDLAARLYRRLTSGVPG